jgi:predicted SprT family Zn-dependent metalloprotease
MLSELDKARSQFAPDDSVAFKLRNKIREGKVIRTNPKRAIVLTLGEEYHVPYSLLTSLEETTPQQRKVRLETIQRQALDGLKKYELTGWRFEFDNSTRRAGCCNYADRIISISFELARNASEEDIHDTILHEIAHALVGKKHNHDKVWKQKAREIGCSGKRTHRLTFSPPRYHVTCENSCWKQTAERKNRRLICRTCGGKLVYSPYSA